MHDADMDVPGESHTAGVSFHRERLTQVWNQIQVMATEHYAETQQHRGQHLRLSLDGYSSLEDRGQHRFDIMRVNGDIVGYCSTFITPDLRDGLLQAHEDAIYIKPEHRGWCGMEFQRWVDLMLECQGVGVSYRERPLTTEDMSREMRRGPSGYHPQAVLWARNLAQPERERVEVTSG